MTMYGVNRSKYNDNRFNEIKKLISTLEDELEKIHTTQRVMNNLYKGSWSFPDFDKQIGLLEELILFYKNDIGEGESKCPDELVDDLLSMFKTYIKEGLSD